MDDERMVDDQVDSELEEVLEQDQDQLEGEPRQDEPFLKVSDRTVYKTPDEAVRGFEEKDRYISQYSQYGKPEEVGKRLATLEALEKMGFDPSRLAGKKQGELDDLLEDIDPKYRDDWSGLFGKVKNLTAKQLEEAGYIRRDDLPKFLDSYTRERDGFQATRTAAREFLSGSGLELGDGALEDLEGRLIKIARESGHPLSESVNRLWDEGNYKELAKLGVEKLWGLSVKKSPPNGQNGESAATRAAHSAKKEETKNLPKRTPNGAAAAESEAASERRKRLSTRDGRRDMALELEKRHLSR